MQAALVFPHQLYTDTRWIPKGAPVFLLEQDLFFQERFCCAKLTLHRASMKYYEQLLAERGYSVHYREGKAATLADFFAELGTKQILHIHYVHTTDYLAERRLTRYTRQHGMVRTVHENPNFIMTLDEVRNWFDGKKKYLMGSFYIEQRKKTGILMDSSGPVGGKWSFDEENRKRFPAKRRPPETFTLPDDPRWQEATRYVAHTFPNSIGTNPGWRYPITHNEALLVLEDFLEHRLREFGTYQDAIVQKETQLFHSLITPALNIGLLSPSEIVERTLNHCELHQVPLNSVEGFIRQVIGWREFMRGVYLTRGVHQRTKNHFGFMRRIPASFYKGATGIDPIDQTIHKLLTTGYCHHIERLMVLGNFMLLCEFHPDDVYQWFMELFVDSYDWVMVPNVYGMSQYADGGMITTKPYVSGSNYILKMSDYQKGAWCQTWDALYWRFIWIHRDWLSGNPRMSMMVRLAEKMNPTQRQNLLAIAEQYLKTLSS